jgi:hypothetical protein
MSNCICATLLIAHDCIPELKGAVLDDFTYNPRLEWRLFARKRVIDGYGDEPADIGEFLDWLAKRDDHHMTVRRAEYDAIDPLNPKPEALFVEFITTEGLTWAGIGVLEEDDELDAYLAAVYSGDEP